MGRLFISYSLTLEFAKDKLKFEGFERGVLENITASDFYFSPSENGKITFAYASSEVQNFNQGDNLFFLKFKALENFDIEEVLKITSSLTPAIGYDEIGNPHNIALAFESVVRKSELRLYPNPATDEFYLDFSFEKESEATLEIYNSLGQLERIIFHNEKFPKGILSKKINIEAFNSGTYFIHFKTKQERFVKRFLKL